MVWPTTVCEAVTELSLDRRSTPAVLGAPQDQDALALLRRHGAYMQFGCGTPKLLASAS
jgi:hypothetical protein